MEDQNHKTIEETEKTHPGETSQKERRKEKGENDLAVTPKAKMLKQRRGDTHTNYTQTKNLKGSRSCLVVVFFGFCLRPGEEFFLFPR